MAAAIAALSTWAKGGLIPQAKHGGRGNTDVAFPASKLDGTGFEKEQIGQTQVPEDCLLGVGAVAGGKGLFVLDNGDEEDERAARESGVGLFTERRRDPSSTLRGLGNSVIFGEDLRNPI